MAEETKAATATATETTAKKPASKRRGPVKRRAAAKRKPAGRRKPVVKRRPAGKAGEASANLTTRAREGGHNVLLVGLGCAGMAYDQVQAQLDNFQDRVDENRKKADKLYRELVKRGEKVEKEARKAVDDIHLPNLELDKLADRKALESRLDKAKLRFEELKSNVSSKFAA